jgi:hypothetical protein
MANLVRKTNKGQLITRRKSTVKKVNFNPRKGLLRK